MLVEQQKQKQKQKQKQEARTATAKTNTGIFRYAQNDRPNKKANTEIPTLRVRMTTLRSSSEFDSGGFCGGLLDGFEDAHVAGAAAEVPGQAFLNL